MADDCTQMPTNQEPGAEPYNATLPPPTKYVDLQRCPRFNVLCWIDESKWDAIVTHALTDATGKAIDVTDEINAAIADLAQSTLDTGPTATPTRAERVTLFLPAGTYPVTGIRWDMRVSLEGEGPSATRLAHITSPFTGNAPFNRALVFATPPPATMDSWFQGSMSGIGLHGWVPGQPVATVPWKASRGVDHLLWVAGVVEHGFRLEDIALVGCRGAAVVLAKGVAEGWFNRIHAASVGGYVISLGWPSGSPTPRPLEPLTASNTPHPDPLNPLLPLMVLVPLDGVVDPILGDVARVLSLTNFTWIGDSFLYDRDTQHTLASLEAVSGGEVTATDGADPGFRFWGRGLVEVAVDHEVSVVLEHGTIELNTLLFGPSALVRLGSKRGVLDVSLHDLHGSVHGADSVSFVLAPADRVSLRSLNTNVDSLSLLYQDNGVTQTSPESLPSAENVPGSATGLVHAGRARSCAMAINGRTLEFRSWDLDPTTQLPVVPPTDRLRWRHGDIIWNRRFDGTNTWGWMVVNPAAEGETWAGTMPDQGTAPEGSKRNNGYWALQKMPDVPVRMFLSKGPDPKLESKLCDYVISLALIGATNSTCLIPGDNIECQHADSYVFPPGRVLGTRMVGEGTDSALVLDVGITTVFTKPLPVGESPKTPSDHLSVLPASLAGAVGGVARFRNANIVSLSPGA